MLPEILPDVASIVVDPAPCAVARPWKPAAFEMNATVVLDELHLTAVVRSWIESSVNKPMAWNCFVKPMLIVGSGGNTVIDTSSGAVTVRVALLEVTLLFEATSKNCAVMAAVPVLKVVAKPLDPAVLLTVETTVLDEVQVTSEVRSCVVPVE